MATEKGVIGHFTGIKKLLFKNLAMKQLQKGYKNSVHVQGIGRKTPEEVDQLAMQDLSILSLYLGDNPYFFGPKPTTVSFEK